MTRAPVLATVRGRLRTARGDTGHAGVSLRTRRGELVRALRETAAHRGGELSAARRAATLAALYRSLSPDGRRDFLAVMAEELGPKVDDLATASRELAEPSDGPAGTARRARAALTPAWTTALRQFNLLPDGTKFLVDLRADLLGEAGDDPLIAGLELDLKDLLADWFDAGFLELRRITWRSPASLLERFAATEAVHAVTGWDDLKNRLDPGDRRFFGFFHPQMPDEPLIFVQVALTRGLAGSIGPLLDPDGPHEDPARADTAVFYSISSTQPGLAGVSLGGFLIKRVVEELAVEFPKLKRFATLSPVPGFRRWLEETDGAVAAERLLPLCAGYLLHEKRADGGALDPVANFHLSNGARIERINPDADTSDRGNRQSYGLMVNYLYEFGEIERNHEAYAADRVVAASTNVAKLARAARP